MNKRACRHWLGLTLGSLLSSGILLGAAEVTFEVNMGIQTEIGRFHPGVDLVDVMGSFNSWSSGYTLTNSPNDTNLYVGTFDNSTDTPGTSLQYKFVIRPNGSETSGDWLWEGNVGVGNQNRTFILADTNQILPIVYFDNLTNNPGAGIAVTFQVSLAAQVANGTFNPAADIVELRGPFYNNWGGGLVLSNSPSHTNLYTTTVKITTAAPGSSIPYKYALNNGALWEGDPNRTFTLANTTQTLPVDYFNRIADLGPLTIVSMANGHITLSWTAAPAVRLQSALRLAPDAWLDVPNTMGIDLAAVPLSSEPMFFRLAGP